VNTALDLLVPMTGDPHLVPLLHVAAAALLEELGLAALRPSKPTWQPYPRIRPREIFDFPQVGWPSPI
jgi:hypothetical protein